MSLGQVNAIRMPRFFLLNLMSEVPGRQGSHTTGRTGNTGNYGKTTSRSGISLEFRNFERNREKSKRKPGIY